MVLTWLVKGGFYKKILLYVKINESADLTYYQKNREVILNRAKDYYENDKESLREQARNLIHKNKYRNLPKEIKIKRENMGRIDTAIYMKKRKND